MANSLIIRIVGFVLLFLLPSSICSTTTGLNQHQIGNTTANKTALLDETVQKWLGLALVKVSEHRCAKCFALYPKFKLLCLDSRIMERLAIFRAFKC